MHSSRAALATLCLVLPILAVACVTITPAKVASVPSVEPSSGTATTPSPAPTILPSAEASTPPTVPPPNGKPGKTPKPHATVEPTQDPSGEPTDEPTPVVDDPACFDDAYTLEGFHWEEPFEWRYNSPSTPMDYDSDEVVAVIQRGFDNVVNENNNCGRTDNIAEVAAFLGTTPLKPCTDFGDGINVVGWGVIPDDLSEDTIAYTCPYHYTATGKIAEADIVLSVDIEWSLSAEDCLFQELLEPTITHEVGHALGLGHVSERSHPDLTMSTRSNGECSNEESTLGLGDMLGLESLYPSGD